MNKPNLPMGLLGDPVQLGYVVKDAQRTSDMMTSLLGVGSWRFEDWPPANRPGFESYYQGQPAKWKTRLAFADFNNVEIELIEPVQGYTGYNEFLEKKGEGLHHLLFLVDDLDAVESAFVNCGIRVKQGASSRFPGARWILLDTLEILGFDIEIRNNITA